MSATICGGAQVSRGRADRAYVGAAYLGQVGTMTTAIVGTEASGGAAAAAVQAQAKAAMSTISAATTPAAAEDTVKISAEAQEVQQATAVQVRLLRNEGQSVPQIATN
jgi:hypothetical protein